MHGALGEVTSNAQDLKPFRYLGAALHAHVVGLGRDQGAQLRLVGALSSVHRGDGQQQRVIVSDQQLRAVPGRGNGSSSYKGELCCTYKNLQIFVLWFLVKSG